MAGPFYNDGTYRCEIIDVAFGEDDSGGAQIIFKVKILSQWDFTVGDWAACTQQYDRTIWLRVPEEEEHKQYVVMKLREAGWAGSRFDTLRDDMLGKNCNVVNRQREAKKGKFAGQIVEGWDLPLPQRESKPLENKPQVAKKLNALFGKVLKEFKPHEPTEAPEAAPVQPAAAVAAGAPPADEVPF